MANKVSFIIELQNKFGRTAAKIKQQFEAINTKVKKVNRSLKTMVTNMRSSAKRFAATAGRIGGVMTAAITVPIVLMGKKMLNAGSDAVETANKFNTVFESVKGKANKVADDFAKSFGVASSTSRKMLGDTGDLLVGFGFAEDAALAMSSQVASLASDLTSFSNFAGGAELANVALTKALLGESESAKALGIVIRQGTPEFKKNVAAIMKSRNVSLLQAKAVEILRISLSQSGKAIGDVSRTWEDYASVQRRSAETSKELSESFGRLMLPLATKFQKLLIKVMTALNSLSPGIKTFILAIAGIVAIGGPLLLLLAGIAAAVALISLPILIISAKIIALIAVIGFLAANWDEIIAFMSEKITAFSHAVAEVGDRMTVIFNDVWDSIVEGIKMAVTFALKFLDLLTAPMRFITEKIAGLVGIDFKFPSISEAIATINTTPVAPAAANGSVSGEIVVSATAGAQIERTALATQGTGLDIGMNMMVSP